MDGHRKRQNVTTRQKHKITCGRLKTNTQRVARREVLLQKSLYGCKMRRPVLRSMKTTHLGAYPTSTGKESNRRLWHIPGSREMSGAASDHRDVQHAPGQIALALHESTVHDRNYPERRVQVSNLRLELSGLMKVPSIHVLRVPNETTAFLVREFGASGGLNLMP